MITKKNIIIILLFLLAAGSYYIQPGGAQDPATPTESAQPAPAAATAAPPATGAEAAPPALLLSHRPTAHRLPLSIDKTSVDNGGAVTVKGQGVPGKPVYLEVWSEKQVKSSFFDSKPDKDGKRPYKLYLTHSLPASYKIYAPKDKKEVFDAFKAKGSGWAYSDALKEMGADVAYAAPAKIEIDAYQSTIMAGIIGSRGDKLPTLDDKETRRRAMQLTKARFPEYRQADQPVHRSECGRILYRQGRHSPGRSAGKIFHRGIRG